MTLQIAILAITCFANLGLGLFILQRNARAWSSVSFFILSITVSLWAVSNFLTEANIPLMGNKVFNSLAYLFAFLSVVAVTVFCYNFPVLHPVSRRRKSIFVLYVLVISALSVTQLVAGVVTEDSSGLHFSVGPLSLVYILALLCTMILGVIRLFRTKRNADVRTRAQVNFIISGFAVTVILCLLLAVIIPTLGKSFETAKFAPLFTLTLVSTISYAIVRYGLFDIKLVVARAAGYVLAVGALASIYTGLVFTATQLLIHDNQVSFSSNAQLLNVGAAVFMALTFQSIKRFFDRLSNRIFYKDNYDPQLLINELIESLVGNVSLSGLLDTTSTILQNKLKVSFCVFYIRDSSGGGRFMSKVNNFSWEISETLRDVPEDGERILLIDEDENLPKMLRKKLKSKNVDAVVILGGKKGKDGEAPLGYMLVGSKKSGNSFTSQDKRILGILSSELLIAAQNALRYEEIASFNETLQAKVDSATHELRRTNEKLKALDEAKDEFISMASHQLRTPLTSVKGYISMVLDGDAGELNEQQHKLLEQSFISSQRMVYLISDLLNVSRLKTGKFIIEAMPVSLPDIVAEEIGQLRETAAARGLSIAFDRPTDFPKLSLDDTKIRQVVMNFLDNAIYYTPAGGTITVTTTITKHAAELRITDTGLGVPKADQHKLFTKFYRANNAKRARPDGTGLGLYMARKVVVAQDGAIIFKSTEGKGSTFGFSFPLSKVAMPEQAPEQAPGHTHEHAVTAAEPAAGKVAAPVA